MWTNQGMSAELTAARPAVIINLRKLQKGLS